jgi:hypothetical protein
MRKKITIILAVVMVFAIVLSVSSCGNIAQKVAEKAIEKVVESAVGTDVSIDTNDDSVKISTDEGVVQAGGDEKIPEWWPSEAPAYPDIKVTYSAKTKDDNGNDGFAMFAEVTKGSVKDVYDWYKSKMTGWETKNDTFGTTDGNDSFSLLFNNGKNDALVMVGSDGSVISFTMSVAASTSN